MCSRYQEGYLDTHLVGEYSDGTTFPEKELDLLAVPAVRYLKNKTRKALATPGCL